MEVKMCDISAGDNSYRFIEVKRGKLTFKMRKHINMTRTEKQLTEIPDVNDSETGNIKPPEINLIGSVDIKYENTEMKEMGLMNGNGHSENLAEILGKVDNASYVIEKVDNFLNDDHKEVPFENSSVYNVNVKCEPDPEVVFDSKSESETKSLYQSIDADCDGQTFNSNERRLYLKMSSTISKSKSENNNFYDEQLADKHDVIFDDVKMSQDEYEKISIKEEPKVDEVKVEDDFLTKENSMKEIESCTGSQIKEEKDTYFRCSKCDISFEDAESLLRHLKSHALKEKSKIECHICKRKFRDHRHIRDHINIHTGEKPYKCPDCNESFSVKGNLYIHRKKKCKVAKMKQEDNHDIIIQNKVNPTVPKTPTTHKDAVYYEIKKIKCAICNKMLLPESMKRHLTYHSDNKPFYCSKCGMRFPVIHDLKRHMQRHDGILPSQSSNSRMAQCRLCSKFFRDQSKLERHMPFHTGIKEFECEICGKKYLYKCGLNRHMLTHNGGPRIECGICGKKFYDSSGLKIHLRAHTGEKPFRCEDCPEEFASKTLLGIHRGRVHLNCVKDSLPDRFFCKKSSCKKGFQFKSVLRTHLACAHLNRSKNLRHKIDVEHYLKTGKYWDGDDAPVHT